MSIDLPAAPTRSTVTATARWLLRVHLYLAAWFWSIAVVVLALVIAVIDRLGTPGTSVVAFSQQGALWFPFAVFIGLTAAYLPVHVATGLTRRSLSLGALIAAVATGLVYGLVFGGLLLVERAVFGAMGWEWRILDGFSPDSTSALDSFVANTLIFVVAYVSGLLVGMSYQRLGGWWGTLALPLTAGPVLLVSALFAQNAGPVSTAAWFDGSRPLLVATVAAVLIVAAMALAFDRLTRGVAVPTRAS
ncbi:hypothetical protein [Cellulomonas sp. P5_C6]